MRGTERPYFLEQPLTIRVKTLVCIDIFFLFFMQLSLATPATQGSRNSWDISLYKARVYALHRGEIFWFKIPADSPAPPKVFSLLTPRLYLAENQKPLTTIALDSTRTTQLPDKITVLKPRSPRHFPCPRVAGVTNDWCITCFKPDFTSFK